MDLMSLIDPTDRQSGIVLSNAAMVVGDEVVRGTLRMAGGVITDIAAGGTSVSHAVDLGGDFLFPGLIDIHTDYLEKHALPRAGVHWHPLAAAASYDAAIVSAGITTVFDSVCVGAMGDANRLALLPRMVEGVRQARREDLLQADHFLHLRCDCLQPDLAAHLEPHIDDPHVRFLTLMDDSVGRDPDQYRLVMTRRGTMPAAEIEAAIARYASSGCTDDDGVARANRRWLLDVCRKRGLCIADHDVTRVEHIAEAVQRGMTVTEFPLTLESAEAAKQAGMTVIVGGPNLSLGKSHTGKVSARELARRGLVDIVCSDYIPSSILHAIFVLSGGDIGLSLPAAVATATTTPARIFGFDDRGDIEIGRGADLVRVRLIDGAPVVRAVWRAGTRVR